MGSIWILPAALVLLGSAAAADPTKITEDAKKAHQETDLNQDGKVDREEYRRRMVDIFYLGDVDRDGYLTEEEFGSAWSYPEDWKLFDHDGNGRLTLYEFIDEAFQAYEEADVNEDGVLSVEEVVDYDNDHQS